MSSVKNKTDYFLQYIPKMMMNSQMNENNTISPDNVYQPAIKNNRELLAELMREGHLPGSDVAGYENILKLEKLADEGKSCIIFSEHVSNMDVPSMFIRFKDHPEKRMESVFEKLIFIAGVKLNQNPVVKLFAEMFTRVVIFPIRGLSKISGEEFDLAKKINLRATKHIMELKNKGNIFVLYPAGTRRRDWDADSMKGMKETMAYLSIFDYFCCCSINGNNMIPQEHEDMTKEAYEEDVIIFSIGEVTKTSDFVKEISEKHPDAKDKDEMRQHQVDEIMNRIETLHTKGKLIREKALQS
ncbi:MAG TPA: hypothetical protein PLE16_00215 [Spirochaetota bacterium]|jgi:glycerol-3-phosphate O-acyltransferase|nr:hypothetical protein [Spirochaetota bacterium]HOH38129.1 hypothetical protein [Spirochaetota bacterium]HPJ13811.1 hypothetical protein [Spirochaetota bacterium]HPM33000.1 hypothetical protein [Spirochaetota bacterium]